jgi:hypothetical protein
MKKTVPPYVFGIIVALVAVGVGFLIWFYSDSAYNRPGAGEAAYRKAEAEARKRGIDPRTDPYLSPLYYKYHPEEKAPPFVPPGPQPTSPPTTQ